MPGLVVMYLNFKSPELMNVFLKIVHYYPCIYDVTG